MDTTVYFNYVQIIESGSITAASRHLHIAQSALSKQIQSMEKEFGVQLLIRNPRSVEPTDMGRSLYEHAKEILELEESFQITAKRAHQQAQGTLKIGTTITHPDYYLEHVCTAFHAAMPMVKLNIYESNSQELLYMLQTNLIDIAYVRMPPSHISNKFSQITSIPAYPVAVFSKDNTWNVENTSEPITADVFQGLPLVVTRGIADELTSSLKIAGVVPNIFCTTSSRGGALFWAERNIAAAIVITDAYSDTYSPTLFSRKLDIPKMTTITRQTSFVIPGNRPISSTAQLFVDFLQSYKNRADL